MDVCRKEKYHDEALACNKERTNKKRTNSANPGENSLEGIEGNNEVVSKRLREELCARLMFGNNDADKICKDILIQGKY